MPGSFKRKAMRRLSDFSVGREMSGHSFPMSMSVDELRRRLSAGVVRFKGSVSGDILKCHKKPSDSRRVSWSLASTEISDADFPSHTIGNCLIPARQGDVLSGDKIIRKLPDEMESFKLAEVETETGLIVDSNVNTNDALKCDKETNLDKIVDSESDYDSEISGFLANSEMTSAATDAERLCIGATKRESSLKTKKPILSDETGQSSEDDVKGRIKPKYVDELERDIILKNEDKNKPEISSDQKRVSSGECKAISPSKDVLVLQKTEEPIYVNMYEEKNKKWSILDKLSDPVKTYLSLHLSIGEHLNDLDTSESSFPRKPEPLFSSSDEQDEMIYADTFVKRKVSDGVVPRKKSQSLIRTVLKDSLKRKISEGSKRGTSTRKISREKNLADDVSGKLIDLKALRTKRERKLSSNTKSEPIYANIPFIRQPEILPYRQMKYAPSYCSDERPAKAAGIPLSELSTDDDIVTRKMSEGILPRRLSNNLIKPLIEHTNRRRASADKANKPYEYHGQFQMEMNALEMEGYSSDSSEAPSSDVPSLDTPTEPPQRDSYVNRKDSYQGQFKMEINANSSRYYEAANKCNLRDKKQGFRTEKKDNRHINSELTYEGIQAAETDVARDRQTLKKFPLTRGPLARELAHRVGFDTRPPTECMSSPLTRKSYEKMDRPVANDVIARNWPESEAEAKVRSVSWGCESPKNYYVRETRHGNEDLRPRNGCWDRSKTRMRSDSEECRIYRNVPERKASQYERMVSPLSPMNYENGTTEESWGRPERKTSHYERMTSPIVGDVSKTQVSWDRGRNRIRTVAGETRMYRNSPERDNKKNMRSEVSDINKHEQSVERSGVRYDSKAHECGGSETVYENWPQIREHKYKHQSRDTSRNCKRSSSRDDKTTRNCCEKMKRPNTLYLHGNDSKSRSKSLSQGDRLPRNSAERIFRPVIDDSNPRSLSWDISRNRMQSDSGDQEVIRHTNEGLPRPVVDNVAFRQICKAHEYEERVRSASEEVYRGKVSVKELIRAFSGDLETTTRSRERFQRTPPRLSSPQSPKQSSPLRRNKFEKCKKSTGSPRSSSLSPCLRKKKKSVGFKLDNNPPENECILSPTRHTRPETHAAPVSDRRCRQLSGEARKRKTGLGSVPVETETGYLDMQHPTSRFPIEPTDPEKNAWLTRKIGPGWVSPRMMRNRKISEGAFLGRHPQRCFIRTMSGNSLLDCKKPMHFENCSAFGGSSTSGTLTSTDSNRSNKDVRNNGTLTSTDSNQSRSQLSQLDVFGFAQKPLEIPLFSEKPISSRSASSSDLRQISLLERLTKTHQIWNLLEVGRIGAVHLLKDREIGTFIVRKSSQPNTMALSIQFPDKDGQPNVDHYLIESYGNKYHLQGSARMFEDVPNLIAFYCENREDLPYCLTLPLAIRRAKTSQELAGLGMLGQAFWTSAKYEGTSRASSRTNLSEHSSVLNKSTSEPISIVQKSPMAAYNQSDTLVQNSPPKHSVLDFSSYLIQKKSEKTEKTECTKSKSANNLLESVQTKCSVSEVKQRNVVNSHMTSSFHQSIASSNVSSHVINNEHTSSHMTNNVSSHVTSNVISGSNHLTCNTFYQHDKERKLSETVLHNVQKDVDLNLLKRKSKSVINRDPKPMVPYAKPKKGKSNLYFTTPIDLVNMPQDTYFTSNLSDKLSDYEDIWKTTGSVYGVGSVQADIVSRLQPNLITNSHNNSSIENSPVKEKPKLIEKEIEYIDKHKGKKDKVIDEKEVFKDSGAEIEESVEIHDLGDCRVVCEFCLCSDDQCPQCSSVEAEELLTKETSLHDDENKNNDCDNEVLDEDVNFEPILEQESDIESDIFASDGCQSDDHDADTEDCDYRLSAKNSVQTQTSPVVKSVPPPLSNVCRKSTSTPELLALKSPVYAEPFDAINPNTPTENVPKVPKKMRRRSAPSFGAVAYKRKLGTSQPPKLTPISSGLEVKRNDDEIRHCAHEEFSFEDKEDDDHCLHCNQSSSKEKKFKPTPNPRKTKMTRSLSQNSDSSNNNRKCVNEVANRLEKLKINNNQSVSETKKHKVQAVDPIRIMEDFENSQCLSSPTVQKFPVYVRQQFLMDSNKTGYPESATAEDIISSWNPELTLQPFKPFPIMFPGAMSEYDNLNSVGYNYFDPSSQSLASAGTIFCKPWENSTLGKLMHTHNQFSPKAQSSAPKVAPPPLPAMDMHERIKAWQESSQGFNSVPTDAEEEYMKSVVSDMPSVEAKTFGGDGYSVSEVKVSTAGQQSQCNKTPNTEKKTKQSEERTEENIPLFGADFREKILPVLANPRLLRHTAHNRQPDTKIREYIIRLSQDRGTTFGSTIENFIQCTLDSHETNPFIVTRNVRQFMNGIKNYLVKHGEGELEDLIERERVKLESDEILNIDAILENALHVCVLQPLKQDIYRLFVNEYTKNGNLKLLSSNIKYARTKTPEEVGIRKGLSPPDMPTLERIKDFLSKMQKSYSPVKKLENLLCATSTIYKWVSSRQVGNGSPSFGADDFLPVLIYVLVQCGMVSVEIEADYMWGLLHPSLLTGEGGYYLTSLSSAVLVLKNFREMQETKTTQPEGKLPSISDMQGFLKIAIPDELRDTIVWRTLPVRPNMNTRDVCSMIAHKFKITNPQDYGLYLLENGEECKLTDTECPQGRKAELLTNKKDCVFAYKRTAANIAWPKSLK